eukprot:g13566.t1
MAVESEALVFSERRGFPLYARTWSRAREALESSLLRLYQRNDQQHQALIFPSGMAAIGATVAAIAQNQQESAAGGGECLFVCDNTWLSGALFNPLDHGADLVVESMTKYVSAGMCIGGAVLGPNGLMAPILSWIKAFGIFVGQDHCQLFAEGLQSLHARMEATSKSAVALAECLEAHPAVNRATLAEMIRSSSFAQIFDEGRARMPLVSCLGEEAARHEDDHCVDLARVQDLLWFEHLALGPVSRPIRDPSMVGPSGLPGSRSLAQPSLPVSSACCRHRPWVEEVAMLMKDLDRLLAQLGPYPEEKDVQKVVPKAAAGYADGVTVADAADAGKRSSATSEGRWMLGLWGRAGWSQGSSVFEFRLSRLPLGIVHWTLLLAHLEPQLIGGEKNCLIF